MGICFSSHFTVKAAAKGFLKTHASSRGSNCSASSSSGSYSPGHNKYNTGSSSNPPEPAFDGVCENNASCMCSLSKMSSGFVCLCFYPIFSLRGSDQCSWSISFPNNPVMKVRLIDDRPNEGLNLSLVLVQHPDLHGSVEVNRYYFYWNLNSVLQR